MTAIRRSEDPSFTVRSTETEASTAPAAKAAPKAPPKAAAQNQLESHKSPAPPKQPDADLVNVSTDLIKGYVHPGLFESSRPDLAQKQLEKLPPREFNAVLGKLDQSGSLERFIGQLDDTQKTAFFDTAARKGALERREAVPQHGVMNPPTVPASYAAPKEAPLGLAKAVNEANIEGAKQLYGAQQDYLDRYEAAVRNCNSGAELRALGPYAKLETVSNLTHPSHPQYSQLHRDWSHIRYPSGGRAQATISNKLSDFMGEAHAGSFFVEGKVEVKTKAGFSGEMEGRLYDTGKVSDTKASAKFTDAQKLSLGLDSKGKVSVGAGVGPMKFKVKDGEATIGAESKNGQNEAKAHAKFDKDGLKSFEGEVNGTGLSYDDGRLQLDVSLIHGAGGYGFSNLEKGEFGGGVKKTFELTKDDEVTLRAGFGMQGLSPANANHALNRFGIWEEPAELLQKKPWQSLDAKQKDAFQRRGWSEQEWSSKVNAHG